MSTLSELQQKRHEITSAHIWANAMTRGSSRPKPPDTRALDQEIAEAKEREGKAYWQRTRDQAARVYGMPEKKHREYVVDAIKRGKIIPPMVLLDYPDINTQPQTL